MSALSVCGREDQPALKQDTCQECVITSLLLLRDREELRRKC